MGMKTNFNKTKNNKKYLNVILETALAEFGSALEMLKACKDSRKESMAYGYFEHAKDEYNHTQTFLSILSKFGKITDSEISRDYRFSTNSVLNKGYVSRDGYLIEIMNLINRVFEVDGYAMVNYQYVIVTDENIQFARVSFLTNPNTPSI